MISRDGVRLVHGDLPPVRSADCGAHGTDAMA
jgi:hypothetical protein